MKKINKKKNRININNIINKRFYIFLILIIFLFGIITGTIIKIMIKDKKDYQEELYSLTNYYVYGNSSPRGRILDRNGKVLVDNKSIKLITYKRDKDIEEADMIKLSYEVSSHLDLKYDKLTDYNKRKFYCIKTNKCKKLLKKKELSNYDNNKITLSELNDLMYERVDKSIIDKFSDEDKKAAYLFYLMNTGYSYDSKTIKTDASDQEYAYIAENNEELTGFNTELSWERTYPYKDTLRSILGSVSNGIPYELKDYYLEQGYSLNDRVGLNYLEKQYENYLKGTKSKYQQIDSNTLKLIREGKRGNDIYLTIDIDLQKRIEKAVINEVKNTKNEANTRYYDHSTVVVQDPNNGEILAMVSKKLVKGKIVDNTNAVFTNPVTPGSVVKGASMLVGYNTGVISIGTKFLDECVKLRGVPEKCSSVDNLGVVDDITALAKSSNVYQFKTAIRVNGSEYYPDMPLDFNQKSFDTYRKMYHSFGLGVKTGIDLPVESKGYTSEDKRAGNLLDFVIGQYETYTPLQLSQYISTIANGGTRYQTHLLKSVSNPEGETIYTYDKNVLNKIDTRKKYMDRVRKGFYAVMHMPGGYGNGFISESLDASGKTGTSQSFVDTNKDGVIDTETVTSNFLTYFPSKKPKYSLTVVSPNSSIPTDGGHAAMVSYRLTTKVSNIIKDMYY